MLGCHLPDHSLSIPTTCPVRLLNSLSLVTIGLSLGYKPWPPIVWGVPHQHLIVDDLQCIMASHDCREFLSSKATDSRLAQPSLQAAARAMQGDCETVYCPMACHRGISSDLALALMDVGLCRSHLSPIISYAWPMLGRWHWQGWARDS